MRLAIAAIVLALAGCSVTTHSKERAPEKSRDPGPGKERRADESNASGDYMPSAFYLAFENGRVPENWRPCLMTQAAAGASGEAEMTDTRTNDKFFTARFARTRPATPADIKAGATVYVMVKWGVAQREKGAAARQFKQAECEWLETTVTGTVGLDSGLFQAPHRETNDIHVSNARVVQ